MRLYLILSYFWYRLMRREERWREQGKKSLSIIRGVSDDWIWRKTKMNGFFLSFFFSNILHSSRDEVNPISYLKSLSDLFFYCHLEGGREQLEIGFEVSSLDYDHLIKQKKKFFLTNKFLSLFTNRAINFIFVPGNSKLTALRA